jgi:hypothetical protein
MASDDDTVIPFRAPTRRLHGLRSLRSEPSEPARRVPIDLRTRVAVRVDDTVSWGHWSLALKYWGLEVARDERDGALVVVRDDDPRLSRRRGEPS